MQESTFRKEAEMKQAQLFQEVELLKGYKDDVDKLRREQARVEEEMTRMRVEHADELEKLRQQQQQGAAQPQQGGQAVQVLQNQLNNVRSQLAREQQDCM